MVRATEQEPTNGMPGNSVFVKMLLKDKHSIDQWVVKKM